MSHAHTVDTDADVTMTVTGDLEHLCPFVDEVDQGSIAITWTTRGQTYELHSLAEYLRGFKDSTLSHEAITDRIRHDLSVAPRILLLSVETTWTTAGLGVSCTSTATRAGADL